MRGIVLRSMLLLRIGQSTAEMVTTEDGRRACLSRADIRMFDLRIASGCGSGQMGGRHLALQASRPPLCVILNINMQRLSSQKAACRAISAAAYRRGFCGALAGKHGRAGARMDGGVA